MQEDEPGWSQEKHMKLGSDVIILYLIIRLSSVHILSSAFGHAVEIIQPPAQLSSQTLLDGVNISKSLDKDMGLDLHVNGGG